MLVQRVAPAGSRVEFWTVLGGDDEPVEAIERYLGYLTAIERSPNTVRAYAHDLKDFFVFLTLRSLDWREVRLEDVGEFVAWLRLPPAGRAGKVVVLPSVDAQVGAATVNRKLSAVSSFYQHQARHGVDVGELLVVWRPGGRGGWKPFLHHISKDLPRPRRAISLRTPRKLPRVLTASETQAVLQCLCVGAGPGGVLLLAAPVGRFRDPGHGERVRVLRDVDWRAEEMQTRRQWQGGQAPIERSGVHDAGHPAMRRTSATAARWPVERPAEAAHLPRGSHPPANLPVLKQDRAGNAGRKGTNRVHRNPRTRHPSRHCISDEPMLATGDSNRP